MRRPRGGGNRNSDGILRRQKSLSVSWPAPTLRSLQRLRCPARPRGCTPNAQRSSRMIRRLVSLAFLAAATSATVAAQSKPAVTPKDYPKWESLGAGRLSPDGQWFAYAVNRVSEENQLRIRP